VEKLALIARLKDGAEPAAQKLVREGPPFDLAEAGLRRHTVFVSAREVVFVFEGDDVASQISAVVDEPFAWPVHDALEAWKPLVDGPPRIARPAFDWERT
jgi:hypothetical protein